MTSMRGSALFFICVVLAMPVASAGETEIDYFKRICTGYTAAVPATDKFYIDTLDADGIKAYLNRKVMCPSACYDIRMLISRGTDGFPQREFISITTGYSDNCSEPKPKPAEIINVFTQLADPNKGRNCASGKGLPSIVIKSDARVEGPKSRCDAKVAETTASLSKGDVSSVFESASKLSAPEVPPAEFAGRADPVPAAQQVAEAFDTTRQLGTVADTGSDADVINELKKFGATDTSDPAANRKALECLAGRCTVEETAKSLESVKLNAATTRDIAGTEVTRPPASTGDDGQSDSGSGYRDPSGVSGFDKEAPAEPSDMDRAKYAISCIESSCGRYDLVCRAYDMHGRRTGCTLDEAWGKYQVRGINVGPWTARYCGMAYSPQQFLADPACQERVFEGEYGRYAAQCGYEGAALRWFTGRCSPNMTVSDGLKTSAIGYLQKFQRYFGASTIPYGSAAPFGGQAGYNARAYYGGSPFTQVNPFEQALGYGGYGSYGSGGYPYQSGTGYTGSGYGGYNPYGSYGSNPWAAPAYPSMPPAVNPVAGALPQPAAPFTPGGGIALPTTPPQPIARLIAQPAEMALGSLINLSWSTAGMRVSPPCRVSLTLATSTALVASANEGTELIRADRVGTISFTLACVSLGGAAVEQKAQVLVK